MKNNIKNVLFLGIIAALVLGVASPAFATNGSDKAKSLNAGQAKKISQAQDNAARKISKSEDQIYKDLLKKGDTVFNTAFRAARDTFNKEMKDAKKAYQQDQKTARDALNTSLRASDRSQDTITNAFNSYRNALISALEKRAKYEQAAYSKFISALRSLTIDPIVKHAPVANNLTVNTKVNTAVAFTLVGSDADGCSAQTFNFTLVNGASNGSITSSSGAASCVDGKITFSTTYTPNLNFSGNDSFTYRFSDGSLNGGTATVSVVVSQ